MRKMGLPVLLMLLILVLFNSTVTAEDVTIRFLSHNYKPWNDLLSEQARAFEELHPNVKVEYTHVEHADLNTRLMTSLVAGTAPDVMGVYGPWMAELVENGWIAAAPDFVVEDIMNNTVPVAGQSAEYDGEIYGYIQHIGIHTPIINVDLYEEAGIDVPTTYEELLAANAYLDIYDDRDRLIQAGATLSTSRDGSWNVIHWSTILKAYGVELVNEDGTEAAFNTEVGREATETYMALTHPRFIDDAFVLGRSAMAWNGPWWRAFLDANAPNLNYQAIAPIAGPDRQVTGMYAWFWVVNANSTPQQQYWAWRFSEFLSNDENYLDMALDIGFISFRNAHYEDDRYATDDWIRTFGEALEAAEIYYAPIAQWESIDVAIGQELERLVVGEITVEQALNNAERRVNEIIAEGR